MRRLWDDDRKAVEGEGLPSHRQLERLKLDVAEAGQELLRNSRSQPARTPDAMLLARFERLRNELAYLEQTKLRRKLRTLGIDVPERYKQSDWTDRSVLTPEGVNWGQREITRGRRAEVEAWGRSLAPFLTFAVSLLSAFIALGSLLVAWAALHKK